MIHNGAETPEIERVAARNDWRIQLPQQYAAEEYDDGVPQTLLSIQNMKAQSQM